MKILDRQIFREVASHALLGLVFFTFVLFLRDTSRLMEMLMRGAGAAMPVLLIWLNTVPSLLAFTIPMAVVLGILVALGRMASEGEVIAMRASGMGVKSFLLPIGVFSVLGCALALWISVSVAPRANRRRVEIETDIGWRQISTELQPRVFEERFPNLILYVQDVISGANPVWKGVFLADLSDATGPKVTLAKEGILVIRPEQRQLQLHLIDGTIHELSKQTKEYSISTFSETDLPLGLPVSAPPSGKAFTLQSTSELAAVPIQSAEWIESRLELQRRFALPFATIALALLGIALGLAAPKGGKSTGIILTLLMVLLYYLLLVGGMSLARQGRLPVWLGTWAADILFAIWGILLLFRVDRVMPPLEWLGTIVRTPEAIVRRLRAKSREPFLRSRASRTSGAAGGGVLALRNPGLPLILDRYVLEIFLFYFVVVLAALLLLTDVATFFVDLLNDVIRNQIPARMVLKYFFYLAPQLIYMTAPLGVLVAVLVSFGILTQTNEITAVKTSGISLYRLTLPIFAASILMSGGLFLFDHFYIPDANRIQDSVRNQIKGRPAQSYYRPDRKWLLGDESRIYYYRFFDLKQQLLGGLTVFDLDPTNFQLVRRVSASRAHWEQSMGGWILEDGWVRTLGPAQVRDYQPFQVRLFSEFHEPPSYFLKEDKQSSQMNFLELRSYMRDLKRSGFDVVPLTVQLYKKFSFPLFAFIMALIGMPFAFSMGKKGALTGIALGIAIAIVYWVVSWIFEALGNLNELPPLVAAWLPNMLFGLGGLYLFLRIET